MSEEVQFDEDSFSYSKTQRPGSSQSSPSPAPVSGGSGMTGWLIKKGIVKSETAAEILLGVFVVVDVAIVYLIIKFL